MNNLSIIIIRIFTMLFPVVLMVAGCTDHIRANQRQPSDIKESADTAASIDQSLSKEKTLLGDESLVGQRLWFVPNPAATLRIGFAKSTMHKDLVSDQLYYPTGTVALQVVEKVYGSGRTRRNKFYRVQFEDGSSAFIEDIRIELALSRFTTSPITKQNVDLARSELFDTNNLSEKFFKEDPMKIKNKIAEIDKAIKKAEAERQARGGVRIGMSEDEVLASSWGKPIEINRTVVKGITSEQWVYSDQNYLYFTDGKLSGIQTNKNNR